MSDDLERRLAERLRAAELPPAPPRLYQLLADLPSRPRQEPKARGRLPFLLLAAALAIGSVAGLLGVAGSRPVVARLPALPSVALTAPATSGFTDTASDSADTAAPESSATWTAPPSIGLPTPVPLSAPPLSYTGTLAVSATFGLPYWDGQLAYPVHVAITPRGSGIGQPYWWGGNLAATGFGGSAASGQPTTADVIAHYSCVRGKYDPTDPTATIADVAAWFVALSGTGVHAVHALDLLADCAAVGHPMALLTPPAPIMTPVLVSLAPDTLPAPTFSVSANPSP